MIRKKELRAEVAKLRALNEALRQERFDAEIAAIERGEQDAARISELEARAAKALDDRRFAERAAVKMKEDAERATVAIGEAHDLAVAERNAAWKHVDLLTRVGGYFAGDQPEWLDAVRGITWRDETNRFAKHRKVA